MSRQCELTGKGGLVGHLVSHSNIKTKRRYLPNLCNVTLLSDVLGGWARCANVNLCSALCRTGQAPVACKIAAVLGRGWPCKPGQAACDWRARCRGAQMLNARYFPAVCI